MNASSKKKGRPKGTTGTGKYGEQTKSIRIPMRLLDQVNELLKKEIKK